MVRPNKNIASCCGPKKSGPSERPGTRKQPTSRITKGSTKGMVEMSGGKFLMGTNDDDGFPVDGEGPIREIEIDPFYIDTTTVTNAEFSKFVKATRYVTEAERFGWSFVFHLLLTPKANRISSQVVTEVPWWTKVDGANWRHPNGPGSDFKTQMDFPVVHISWNDAIAYCDWTGKRLPTEAEWEFAARGGLEQKKYPWGNDLMPNSEHQCNIWQGVFPDINTKEDGYVATAPAKSFRPNEFGLYNMAGNVWEWTGDWFSATYHIDGPRKNPSGPESGNSVVTKGGSYLCHESYCNRYRVAARTSNTPDSSTGNTGFRCVRES